MCISSSYAEDDLVLPPLNSWGQKAVLRIAAAAFVHLSLIVAALAQTASWTPDSQLVDDLESRVVLPEEVFSIVAPAVHQANLAAYARFYAGMISGGRRT